MAWTEAEWVGCHWQSQRDSWAPQMLKISSRNDIHAWIAKIQNNLYLSKNKNETIKCWPKCQLRNSIKLMKSGSQPAGLASYRMISHAKAISWESVKNVKMLSKVLWSKTNCSGWITRQNELKLSREWSGYLLYTRITNFQANMVNGESHLWTSCFIKPDCY